MHVRGSAEPSNLLLHRLERFAAPAAQAHRCPAAAEFVRDGAADARARARNEGCLSLMVHAVTDPTFARSSSRPEESATCTTRAVPKFGSRFIMGASTSLAPHSMI